MPSCGYAECTKCDKKWENMFHHDPDRWIVACHKCQNIVKFDRFIRRCPTDTCGAVLKTSDLVDQSLFRREESDPQSQYSGATCPFCSEAKLNFTFNCICNYGFSEEFFEVYKKRYLENPESYEATVILANVLFHAHLLGEATPFFEYALELADDSERRDEIRGRLSYMDKELSERLGVKRKEITWDPVVMPAEQADDGARDK